MDIIDNKGRLFGTVNIIDTLVVLLLLATVSAGGVFILQTDSGDTNKNAGSAKQSTQQVTRFVTVNLGTYPSYIAEHITEGDTSIATNLRVNDVYRAPTKKGIKVWVRVQLNGSTVKQENTTTFKFAGKRAKPGSELVITTEKYNVKGTIQDLDTQNPSLPGKTTHVVLQAKLDTETANAIEINDTYTVANGTVAKIKAVDVYPTNKASKKRVTVGIDLRTLNLSGQQEFLDRPVQLNNRLTFRADNYDLRGKIVHRGTTTLPGENQTMTATVKLSGVMPEIANNLKTGMVERINGDVNARILNKRVKPATVILKSQNGEIHKRSHPTKKDVYLTVKLTIRQTESGIYFHGLQLQEGNGIILDLKSITIRGQTTNIKPKN